MAHRFMEQHAGPSRTQHHHHLAGRCVDRFEVNQRLARGLLRVLAPSLVFQEITPFNAATAAESPGLAVSSVLRDDGDVEPAQRLAVGGETALAVDHHHHLVLGGERRNHHFYPRVDGARRPIDLFQQPDLLPNRDFGWTGLDRVQLMPGGARPDLHGAGFFSALVRDRARGLRRQAHPVHGHLVGIGVAGAILGADPHANSLGDALGGLADDRLLQSKRLGTAKFEKKVGIIRLALQRRPQRPFKRPLVQTEAA